MKIIFNHRPGKTEKLFDQENTRKSTLCLRLEEEEKQTAYLKIKNKYDEKIELFKKINNGKFITIFNYQNTKKEDEFVTNTKYINKIVKYNENLIPLNENEINGKVHCFAEIEEEKSHLIFSQNNGLYSLTKDNYNPKFIADIKIYLILQINSYKYIISNDNGTYIYKGSILNKITRKNLESSKRIGDGGFKLGVMINEDIIALVKKETLVIFDLKNEKEIFKTDENYSDFRENCLDLFKSENNINILLLACSKSKNNGVLKIEFKNGNFSNDFFEINYFEIHCFMRIEKLYAENVLKAFLENYDKDCIYFLFGGKENNKNKIKLFKLYLNDKSMEDIKDIWVEKDDIFNKLPNFKSINQNKPKSLIVNYNGGETIMFEINYLKEIEQNIIDLVKYKSKRIKKKISKTNDKKNNSYENIEQKIIKKESIDNLIKFIYKLKNGYYIIAQDNKIFVLDNFSYVYNHDFKDNYYTYCICQKSETDIFIGRSDGLYNLNLKDKENVRIYKINSTKYYLILKINYNEYIVSHDKGIFRVKRDLPSINKEDLKKEENISDKAYKLGLLMQRNNKNIAILMDNIGNEEGVLIVKDINNIKNNYTPIKNKFPYALTKTTIISLQSKENPNNYVHLCATQKLKDNQKNGLLAFKFNIEMPPFIPILENFHDTYNFTINSMTVYEKENNDNKKYFTHFLIGGNTNSYEFEIRLFKIMFLDGNGNDCLCFVFIKKVIYHKFIQKYYSYSLQSISNGQLIISSQNEFYLYKIEKEVQKELTISDN